MQREDLIKLAREAVTGVIRPSYPEGITATKVHRVERTVKAWEDAP